jgi:hypothetical protein
MNYLVVLSLILTGFAVVGVFVEVPLASDYAFWFLLIAYLLVLTAWRGKFRHDD